MRTACARCQSGAVAGRRGDRRRHDDPVEPWARRAAWYNDCEEGGGREPESDSGSGAGDATGLGRRDPGLAVRPRAGRGDRARGPGPRRPDGPPDPGRARRAPARGRAAGPTGRGPTASPPISTTSATAPARARPGAGRARRRRGRCRRSTAPRPTASSSSSTTAGSPGWRCSATTGRCATPTTRSP